MILWHKNSNNKHYSNAPANKAFYENWNCDRENGEADCELGRRKVIFNCVGSSRHTKTLLKRGRKNTWLKRRRKHYLVEKRQSCEQLCSRKAPGLVVDQIGPSLNFDIM